ncbi:MAG: hypothetical protein WCK09_12305 [Bacteroidota bacterium]
MKTRFLFIAICMFASSQYLCAQNFDFRNVTWGMDSSHVKQAEKAKYIDSKNNRIVYSVKLDNQDAKIFFYFTSGNQLYKAFYMMNLESKNPSVFVKNYLMMQELLTEKYHAPYSNSAKTINGRTITPEEWASNLVSDNLNLETKWKTDKTDIGLCLYSLSDELILEISYTSLEFEKKSDIEKRNVLLKDL